MNVAEEWVPYFDTRSCARVWGAHSASMLNYLVRKLVHVTLVRKIENAHWVARHIAHRVEYVWNSISRQNAWQNKQTQHRHTSLGPPEPER